MNKFERLKSMSTPEAQKFIRDLFGEESAKKFFEEEKLTVSVDSVKVGSFIKYANIEWVVLDKVPKGMLVLAKDCLFNLKFDDENNNWKESSLRDTLNNFDNKKNSITSVLNEIKKSDLVKFKRDLTTDDGIKDYGECEDCISLYTCDEYRRYRSLIPAIDKWHWTITADSLVYSYIVRLVYSNGALSLSDACSGSSGVRPLCVLKSKTEVEIDY